jgi:hypothetical protein
MDRLGGEFRVATLTQRVPGLLPQPLRDLPGHPLELGTLDLACLTVGEPFNEGDRLSQARVIELLPGRASAYPSQVPTDERLAINCRMSTRS